VLLPFTIYADNQTFNIFGKVYFTHKKTIHIFLVDEEISKKPFIGIDTLIVTPNSVDIDNGYISYIFRNVRDGVYGIRCFQDMNGNKKLDEGLFGPDEPWGLSWNENKKDNWPSFKNFCFKVTCNTNSIDIKLKD
jgi:uncharacterized protein (DUF2141 family)